MKPLDFDHIPPFFEGDPEEPYAVHAIVETPRGSGHKYGYNEHYGVLELSRILQTGLTWPCDFGFIPQPLARDGDPLDIALLIDEACSPDCLVRARLLGVIGMVKNGKENNRVLVCPTAFEAPQWREVRSLDDLSRRQLRELEAFFADYNTFEGAKIELTGWRGVDAARDCVEDAVQHWRARHVHEE